MSKQLCWYLHDHRRVFHYPAAWPKLLDGRRCIEWARPPATTKSPPISIHRITTLTYARTTLDSCKRRRRIWRNAVIQWLSFWITFTAVCASIKSKTSMCVCVHSPLALAFFSLSIAVETRRKNPPLLIIIISTIKLNLCDFIRLHTRIIGNRACVRCVQHY